MSFSTISAALDTMLAHKSLAVHDCLIDCETLPDGLFAIVLRSRDKAVIGRTNTPDDCIYRLSDRAGAPVPFTVLTGDDKAQIDTAAQELRAFYAVKPDATFSARFNALGECARAALPFALALFGTSGRLDEKGKRRNGWALGTFHELSAAGAKAKAEQREADIAAAAKALHNADALTAAIQRQSPGKVPAELLAMVNSIIAQIQGTAPAAESAAA